MSLINIADALDKRSLIKEADYLDAIVKKMAGDLEMPSLAEDILSPNVGEYYLALAGAGNNLSDEPVNSLDDLTIIIDNPECNLECAEYAALKYRSSSAYQENEDIEKEIVNALVNSKRPEPGVPA